MTATIDKLMEANLLGVFNERDPQRTASAIDTPPKRAIWKPFRRFIAKRLRPDTRDRLGRVKVAACTCEFRC